MDHLDRIGKQHRGQDGFPFHGLLLFQEPIEAAQCLLFQPAHGAALIQDTNQFCKIFHDEDLLVFCWFQCSRNRRPLGRLAGDIYSSGWPYRNKAALMV